MLIKKPGIVAVQIAERESSIGVELCVEEAEQADKVIQECSNVTYVNDDSAVQDYITQYFGEIQVEI